MSPASASLGSCGLLLALLAALPGCLPSAAPPDDPLLDVPDTVRLGPEVVCSDPVQGFDRFVRTELSIPPELQPTWPDPFEHISLTAIVHDLDADGDLDLLLERPGGLFMEHLLSSYQVIENMGGEWMPRALQEFTDDSEVFQENMTVVDMDGDGLPDMVSSGLGTIAIHPSLGDLTFGPPTFVKGGAFVEDGLMGLYGAAAVADLDGDLDLDIAAATTGGLSLAMIEGEEEVPFPVANHGHSLLFQGGDGFTEQLLIGADIPWIAEVIHATDRDGDGDMDVLIGGDIPSDTPPLAFLSRQGDGQWRNDSEALGAGIQPAAMGIASWDFNEDGQLDYCITDIGPVKCLVSGDEGYVESGLSLGFEPPSPAPDPPAWSGWSMDIIDLDNDGLPDAAIAGGVPWRDVVVEGFVGLHPDGIYQGTAPGAFQDRTVDLGFGDEAHHFGLATGDLNGDGFWEVVIVGSYGPDIIWWNQCGDGSWIDIDLLGPPENTEG